MVNCPECGKPLKKVASAKKYYCENRNCIVIFVRHPYESQMRIAYTAFARYESKGLPREPHNQKSLKQRLGLLSRAR